jgi:epoxyqueuosine reductase
MVDLLPLKETIKTEAKRLGFNHIGIAPCAPAPHYRLFLEWVTEDHHASMDYLAREDTLAKRADPALILEGCQRVICLTMPYQVPQAGWDITFPGKGRVSAYAVTQDYHQVIWEKLRQLEDFIAERASPDVRTKSYTDTGPILERDFAATAGIGIAGKNSCLLIQGEGSYFFLAEVLTDLELPVDAPYTRDLCGSCTRCIDACPTACILPNRTIAAERCISYLTIEHRGVIPDERKAEIGSWLFGCDICQMVCPHNAFPEKQESPLGKAVLPEQIDLISLFALDEEGFDEKFGETPLARTKRVGLLRNAAIVLGNQVENKALPALQNALSHETDPGLLDACRWAIAKINHTN